MTAHPSLNPAKSKRSSLMSSGKEGMENIYGDEVGQEGESTRGILRI
jgi:hypothetical protein